MLETRIPLSFLDVFGESAELTETAPGRVNLIGEHTDYHGGFVLPATIPQRTSVEIRARDDGRVRAWTTAVAGPPVEYTLGHESPRHQWVDYVAGVTRELLASASLRGCDLRIDSEVPLGSGLSSSAALEVAVLRALRSRFALPIDDLEVARMAHRAETEFVGAPVGIMDQFVCSVGRDNEAVFLDTATLAHERIALPADMELVVVNSGVTHQHAGGEYATRRRESFEAAAALGVARLRDVSVDDLARIEALPPPLNKRARHIVTENLRVQQAAAALRDGLLTALGTLFNASHRSMRDDYDVSTPDIDALVEIAQSDPHIYGARLTGGGFGGCIVAIADAGAGVAAATRVLDRYSAKTGRTGTRLLPLHAA